MERIAAEVALSDGDTVEEQARVIAMCTADGKIRPKLVTDVLTLKGLTQGDSRNHNGYVSKQLRNSRYWERLKHGVYQFIGHPAYEEVNHE